MKAQSQAIGHRFFEIPAKSLPQLTRETAVENFERYRLKEFACSISATGNRAAEFISGCCDFTLAGVHIYASKPSLHFLCDRICRCSALCRMIVRTKDTV